MTKIIYAHVRQQVKYFIRSHRLLQPHPYNKPTKADYEKIKIEADTLSKKLLQPYIKLKLIPGIPEESKFNKKQFIVPISNHNYFNNVA